MPRVAVYLWLDRWLNRALRGVRVLHEGLWLGLIPGERLQEVTSRQYARTSQYARTDSGHNARGLFGWEQAAVSEHFPPGARVLVAAAGGGREVLALRRLGYLADGFDCVPDLVEAGRALLARNGASDAGMALVPADGLPAVAEPYDALVLGWGAYIHMTGATRRIAFLGDFSKLARPGAPLLFSFFVRSRDARRFDWIHRIAGTLRRLRGDRTPLEHGDTLDSTFDHYFTEDEIRAEVEAAGLALVEYRGEPFGHAIARVRPPPALAAPA